VLAGIVKSPARVIPAVLDSLVLAQLLAEIATVFAHELAEIETVLAQLLAPTALLAAKMDA
jgi:hypothetical protein